MPAPVVGSCQAGTQRGVLGHVQRRAGTATAIPATAYDPRYGLDTITTTDDANGLPAAAETTTTGYTGAAGSGFDPVYGLATDKIVDPNLGTSTGHLALDTKTTYEKPGIGFLRPTATALPSASISTAAQDTTTAYYGAGTGTGAGAVGAANTCASSTTVPQGGLPHITTSPTPGSGAAVATEFVYDSSGRVVASRVVADGSSWTCTTYDSRGRVTKVAYPAVNGATVRTVTTSYSADGLTTTVSDSSGSVTARTDLLGRTVSYTDAKGTVTATTYDQAGRDVSDATTGSGGGSSTVTTSYLDDGRVAMVSLDGNLVAQPGYDSAAQLMSVTYSTGAGAAGNGGSLSSITRGPQGHETGQVFALNI